MSRRFAEVNSHTNPSTNSLSVIVKDKLTEFWENLLVQNDTKNAGGHLTLDTVHQTPHRKRGEEEAREQQEAPARQVPTLDTNTLCEIRAADLGSAIPLID